MYVYLNTDSNVNIYRSKITSAITMYIHSAVIRNEISTLFLKLWDPYLPEGQVRQLNKNSAYRKDIVSGSERFDFSHNRGVASAIHGYHLSVKMSPFEYSLKRGLRKMRIANGHYFPVRPWSMRMTAIYHFLGRVMKICIERV